MHTPTDISEWTSLLYIIKISKKPNITQVPVTHVCNPIQDQPRQKVHKTPSLPVAGQGGTLVIPATWEAEIGRITAPGQPGQKSSQTPSQWKKAGCGGVHLGKKAKPPSPK
jgi:hypothetical protein